MRIQHNIAALNSYRQLGSNNNAVSKNLEKLSSGYRINRAGDDAAGLAISEKMRAQITGLNTAQKNANDGISLVQTAEGALTEVHSMLNRMVELADQSANGTYQDKVDRENLQKEITALKDEIDRIADSTNFNGINLLDGSLGKSTGVGGVNIDVYQDYAPNIVTVDATQGKYQVSVSTSGANGAPTVMKAGDSFSIKVGYTDASGVSQTKELSFKFQVDSSGNGQIVAADGKIYNATDSKNVSASDFTEAIKGELQKDSVFGENFKVTDNNGKIDFEAKKEGASGAKITDFNISYDNGTSIKSVDASLKTTTTAIDMHQKLDFSTGFGKTFDYKDAEKTTFEVNGVKFAFITGAKDKDGNLTKEVSQDTLQKLKDAGVDHYVIVDAKDTITATAVTEMVGRMNQVLGTNFTNKATNGEADPRNGAQSTTIYFIGGSDASGSGKGGLTLQIGDTADDYNQLKVAVGDMHVSALGIGSIDIGTQQGAKDAVAKLKSAINSVSSTRGDLGAVQNRLEHTINNLSVTTENMTAAESRIRDVDMASEMMNYTKNNILVQASQSMLAQANQLPQGVLQLLQ